MTKRGHLRRLVAAGPIDGAAEGLRALLGEAAENEADAAVIVGDLAAPGAAKRAFGRSSGRSAKRGYRHFGCRAPRTHR